MEERETQKECKVHGWQDIKEYLIYKNKSKPYYIWYQCRKCEKARNDTRKEYRDNYNAQYRCTDAYRARQRERSKTDKYKAYRKTPKARTCRNERQRKKGQELRLVVLKHYAGDPPSCAICNESALEFLAIDHANGHGNEHRKLVGTSDCFVRWLIRNNFPDGFRILCHNCNFKYRDNSECKAKTRETLTSLSQSTRAKAQRKYASNNPEKVREQQARYRKKLKSEAMNHYGGKCACCGIDDLDVLAIDHVNGGGNKHRKQIGNGAVIYQWLKNNRYPNGFRVLCMNCNRSRGSYGYCPHENHKVKKDSRVLTPSSLVSSEAA